MIRSTFHPIKFSNTNKKQRLNQFLQEYQRAVQKYIDFLWENRIDIGNGKFFDIKNNEFYFPKHFDYKMISFETNLSARALSSAVSQASGVVRSITSKKMKALNKIEYLKSIGKRTEKLERKLEQKFSKPNVLDAEFFSAELSSKCVDFKEINTNSFSFFIRLRSLGKPFGFLKIPINHYDYSNKWKNQGTRMGSILINNKEASIRYKVEEPAKVSSGAVVGADTGFKTILTLSNEQTTPEVDIHGHSLETICRKLARKKKDSKGFKKAVEHRKNFINWSINQLNFNGVKQINLEKIFNLFHKNPTSRLMSHFANSLIEEKILKTGEELGVQINLHRSMFYSQRCSNCGYVYKPNRNKKQFRCRNCGFQKDADLNSALNHEIELCFVPYWVYCSKMNRSSGFFWNPEGLFDLNGQALEFPVEQKI